MAKVGRKKKNILSEEELEQYYSFQALLSINVEKIGLHNLTDKEKSVYNDLKEHPQDSKFEVAKKMLLFKRYFLHKDLTQDECTYFIAKKNGQMPKSDEDRVTKMTICKLEDAVMMKLRISLMKKHGICKLNDCLSPEHFRMPAKIHDPTGKGKN